MDSLRQAWEMFTALRSADSTLSRARGFATDGKGRFENERFRHEVVQSNTKRYTKSI
jgi:hypothetical protein